MRPIKISMTLAIALTLTACAAPTGNTDLGPMKYDASGTMACSAGAPTYSEACGWRVVRKAGGGAEIWISNIAVRDKPAYRVLDFSGGEFSMRDGAKLQVSKDGDTWSVSVPGKEYYRFADALITGG
jgi:hypothetical protein